MSLAWRIAPEQVGIGFDDQHDNAISALHRKRPSAILRQGVAKGQQRKSQLLPEAPEFRSGFLKWFGPTRPPFRVGTLCRQNRSSALPLRRSR